MNDPSSAVPGPLLSEIEKGYLLGVLASDGHFGGDGRQAQVTLRKHVRHEDLFRWLEEKLPGGRLYGPYHHSGREYFQWMIRGAALENVLVPLIRAHAHLLDEHVRSRFEAMCADYGLE